MSTHTEFLERLSKLEKNITDTRFREAASDLVTILEKLEFAVWNLDDSANLLNAGVRQEATRLATAITDFMSAAGYQITQGEVVRIACFKRTIAQIFEISKYTDTRHFLSAFGTRNPDGTRTLTAQETAKLLLCLSINQMNDEIIELLRNQKSSIGVPVMMGLLSEQVTWSKKAVSARANILAMEKNWTESGIHVLTIGAMVPAYMGCSYAEAEHKHEIKKYLNALARNYALERGCRDIELPEKRLLKARPTIAVVAELYDAAHAMHRVFGTDIQLLMKHFDTVLMTTTGNTDERLRPCFSKIDDTPFDRANPKAFCDAVTRHEPDIIYFPSIGMRPVSILLSNLRLAPIQVMTFGHPATTHSEFIDYAVVHDGALVDPDTVSETVLLRSREVRFLDHPDSPAIEAKIRARPEIVTIAVPAWLRKITPTFLGVCTRIVERAERPVRFVFFPNCSGTAYQAFKRRVEDMLPADVVPTDTYPRYLRRLNQCDLFLSSFPFGATNGIIDATRLGLPIVNMKGREMHSIIDSLMTAELGAPAWLSVNSVDEYIDAVLRLIHDDELRIAVGEQVLKGNIRQAFRHDRNNDDFVGIFDRVFQHHEEISAAARKCWSYRDLQDLGSRNEDDPESAD